MKLWNRKMVQIEVVGTSLNEPMLQNKHDALIIPFFVASAKIIVYEVIQNLAEFAEMSEDNVEDQNIIEVEPQAIPFGNFHKVLAVQF
jgi:hypothetical protein